MSGRFFWIALKFFAREMSGYTGPWQTVQRRISSMGSLTLSPMGSWPTHLFGLLQLGMHIIDPLRRTIHIVRDVRRDLV
jgi:hypothetical protein